MRWPSLASASRRALDSNSSSVSAGVSKGRRVKALVHQLSSFLSLSLRMASGEGGVSGAGSSASISLAG